MLKGKGLYQLAIICGLTLVSARAWAQPNVLQGITNRIGTLSNGSGSGGSGDSLRSRAKEEETTQVRIYFLDSTRAYAMDSSILDYTTRFPIPATHIFLGNTGSATRSLLFAPRAQAGFDPGFHAFDAYKFTLEKAHFFNATKPYTELSYTLASRAEQIIDVMHTQNLRPSWNIGLRYRMINAPGTFRNQKTNHNNYLISSWYQSYNKRYNNYFVFLLNSLQAGENGGIRNDKNYLDDPVYAEDRYTIPTYLGGEPSYVTNFFSTNIPTGNKYKETSLLLRQQYDLGRKDSVVTDSTVIPLFYPRLRFEHTLRYGNYRYAFQDLEVVSADQRNVPDSAYYQDRYGITLFGDSIIFQDKWREISNDFSIYQFPDANNLHQFIKVGLEAQLLSGNVRTTRSLYNLMGHGEYRNRTRNQKWDINAWARLWLNGYNMGDYHAFASLLRQINPKVGSLMVGFENINRTAPFIYNETSSFYLDQPRSFGKENTIHLFASIFQPRFRIRLNADYYLVSNYLYLEQYYKLRQEASLFNVLRVSASKTFNLGRVWRWHADVWLQQKTGAVPVNMPLFYTRNRIGYEGKLGFKKLNVAFGTELRYHSPYKADSYSPVLGQFFFQDSVTINNLPQVDLYLHMQIRSFRAFLRWENLNTARTLGGFGFTNNNFAAPDYPTPGLVFRLGIYWGFVN